MRKKHSILLACLVAACIAAVSITSFMVMHKHQPTLKVGILHSLTGTMAISEKSVAEATLFAIEEINNSGGIMGMKIEPILADGKSDPDVFQKEAERLIAKEKVNVIFGCWTSASRKSVKPVVEKYNALLFYPVQYEGLEESPNIIYMGAAPNQQLIPAIKWSCDNLGKKFFLVGSDYVFPGVANKIATDVIGYFGGEVAGEEYVPLGSEEFTAIANKIKETKPEVILNTVNGDSNGAFFEALDKAEIDSTKVAVMSLSIAENEIVSIRARAKKNDPQGAEPYSKNHVIGSYVCWNYLESIDSPLNKDFVSRLRKKYGEGYNVTDPMEAGYLGVRLWSQAVNECRDVDNVRDILNHLKTLSFPAPEGIISLAGNNHIFKTVRIGKVNDKGKIDIAWTSNGPVEPNPFPNFRSKAYWKSLLNNLSHQWNDRWNAGIVPGESPER